MAKTTDYIHCDSPRPFTAVAVLFQTHNRRQYVRVVNIDRAGIKDARADVNDTVADRSQEFIYDRTGATGYRNLDDALLNGVEFVGGWMPQ